MGMLAGKLGINKPLGSNIRTEPVSSEQNIQGNCSQRKQNEAD